uniref:Ig-like domain-containing protein n=1 Tax=Corvus moneduloides TaxID=1196302 RepID=A0A8U7NR75_CORMO
MGSLGALEAPIPGYRDPLNPTHPTSTHPQPALFSSGPGLPQFVSMGSLDGIPSRRRRSERDRAEPQAPGMAAGAEPGSWDPRSRHSEQHRHGATREPEMLQDRHSQKCGILGGQNLGTWEFPWKFHGWISVNPFPWKFCRWTSLPSHSHGIPWADLIPIPLPWNLMAASHRDPIPEPPDVHVSGKVEHGILTLSCHAYGFYPSTIGISWMKGMKSGIVPNRDSTFHPWPGIEALPEERDRSGREHRPPCIPQVPGEGELGPNMPGGVFGGGRDIWSSQ